jgi:polysaccharide chain length determinant protein (PEP-CTERM system associated)
MTEDIDAPEEQQSERFDLERYLNIARRRHMHFLLPLLAGWLLVWGASWVLPALYKSTTLILVEAPSMPKDYVAPNVSEDLQDRLQSITQQILSRTRLLSIIDKLHLYGEGHTQATDDQRVELMRKDIDIELVHGENQKEITGFTVTYSAHDPQIAQQVTSELTDLFIDENLKARQQESEDTTKFIESQLENARTTLAEQEAKVRDFEGRHEGELPSQQATNLQILSGLQAQLQNEQDTLNTAKQQRVYFQALSEQYRALSGNSGTVEGAPATLPAINQQLEMLRSKLANLSSQYTDRYPDVQNLKTEIAQTERMRDTLIAGLKDKGSETKSADHKAAVRDATGNPQSSATLQLESQLQANLAEIGNREQGIAALKTRINDYQARLNNEPGSEQQLADLTRGYDQSKANFDDLLKKKNESSMATSMEQMQQGERFKMLDPPSLPLTPYFPNRLKFCGIGLGVGLALGLIFVVAFEFMDDRMYSEQEIKTLLPMAILTEIPEIILPSDGQIRKKKTMLGWATAVLVICVILAGSAFSFLHG